MKLLSDRNQAAFNSTSRYLDDLLNIDNPYFVRFVSQIYPSEIQLNKANRSEMEASFLELHLSISNGFVSSKIYDKREDFDFDIEISHSGIGIFHEHLLMEFTYLNLFVLL